MKNESPKPILVTGASGFLGSHVVTEIYKAGFGGRVHIMLRSSPDENSLLALHFRDNKLDVGELKPRTHFVDLKDKEKFKATLGHLKNLSREWVVIHLAAIINPQGDERAQEEVNFDRTKELLEWTNENGSRFIYTSSIVAFGGTPYDKVRSEVHYKEYHWLNKLDGYSSSKRKAHDKILEISKVSTVVLCPGIIHGAYEHKKSSRAHLEIILKGKVRIVPGGKGAFVSLASVGEQILYSATSEKFNSGTHVRLLNDVCLNYPEYFELYRECAGKEPIKFHAVPAIFVYLFAALFVVTRIFTKKAAKIGKLVQAFLFYDFRTEHSFAEGKKYLKQAITESFDKRG
jgi:nucleoside-diphosphate-sugar epimerase